MKSLCWIFAAAAAAASLASCVRVRPITPMPDGNRDRMLKEVFSGTKADPKFWIYKVTVTDTSFGTPALVFSFEGLQSEARAGYFEFTRDKLKFHNAVNRRLLESEDIASQGGPELINEWDIKHSEYRLAEVDGYTTNREEENKYIPWRSKRYFTVDWGKADISEKTTFPYFQSLAEKERCWAKKASHVIDSSREAGDDYITWTVAVDYEQDPLCSRSLKRWSEGNFVSSVHYKYSFKRIPDPRQKDESYEPYVYAGEQDPLLKKYGFFRTVRAAIAEDQRDKNIFYMNRWNPNKKHVFYFTEDYPEKYKDIAHGAVCSVNRLLAKHKLNDYPLDGNCRADGSALPLEGRPAQQGYVLSCGKTQGRSLGISATPFFISCRQACPSWDMAPLTPIRPQGRLSAGM